MGPGEEGRKKYQDNFLSGHFGSFDRFVLLFYLQVKYMSANAYLKRQDENFFRISATQLAELMAEYDDDGGHSPSQQQQQQQRGYNQNSSPNARYHNIIAQPHMERQEQALPSRAVRGGPTIVQYSEEEQPSYEKPYLLVDIRDR